MNTLWVVTLQKDVLFICKAGDQLPRICRDCGARISRGQEILCDPNRIGQRTVGGHVRRAKCNGDFSHLAGGEEVDMAYDIANQLAVQLGLNANGNGRNGVSENPHAILARQLRNKGNS
jgi:hypothetical protein